MAWITTVVNLAPHLLKLSEIAVAAVPHFTRRKAEPAVVIPAVDTDRVTQQQIAELQAVAAQNAEYIRELAGDLQTAITAIEVRFRRLELLIYAALALAAAAAILAAAALVRSL